MAKWKFDGLDAYTMKIEAITKETQYLFGKAIYGGAKVVADEIKEAVWTIPVDDSYYSDHRAGIRANERIDLANSFGIAPMRDDNGYINVKVGWDDYNRYGTANAVIARAVESGTSFMPKFGTISKAARRAKKKCEQEMESILDSELQKLMK